MYHCPDCTGEVQDQMTKCPSCERNLTAIATLNEFPDALFNKALAALKNGDLTSAVNCAGAALQFRFSDPELWMLQGHAALRLGALDLARNSFQMVQVMKRDYEPAQTGLKLIDHWQAAADQQRTEEGG